MSTHIEQAMTLAQSGGDLSTIAGLLVDSGKFDVENANRTAEFLVNQYGQPGVVEAPGPVEHVPAVGVEPEYTDEDLVLIAANRLDEGLTVEQAAQCLVDTYEGTTVAEATELVNEAREKFSPSVPEVAAVPGSKFREIARAALARGEKRIVPIAVGGKNPCIRWAANEANIAAGVDTRIDTFSTEQWDAVADAWVEELAAKFPDMNAAVIAKPDEFLYIDEDSSKEFRDAYEQWSGEAFPVTYATSARANRLQSHWIQNDATRKMGNIVQGATYGGMISVRQRNEYVLAEGSQHKNGVDTYRSVGGAVILPFPDKLVEFIQTLRMDRNKDTNDFTKKPEGWLDEPFIHGNINNQVTSFIGHYIGAKNMKDPDELFLLIESRIEKNGCFYEDGVTPYAWNREEVREMCREKVRVWKTGEELRGQPLEFNQKPDVVQSALSEPEDAARYAMTPEEVDAELEKEFPVIPLKEQVGPEWNDDIMYGLAGDIIRKASQYCEAHPAGMYLDLLVAVGNIIGRGPYFNISQTRHYTNQFMARVGDTADSRKGTGRDAIDEVLRVADNSWYSHRVLSGFGSAEAIVNELRDPMQQQVVDKKSASGFREILVPGIDDKRLCIREGELASIFQLAGKNESRADIVLRDGWDGKALRNLVKGKSKDGLSNSAVCQEPHLSISGDTTRSELMAKMPPGAAENGFGNRFLYCYVYRTKLCPVGGPILDWSSEVVRLHHAIEWAKGIQYVPLTQSANKTWKRMYMGLDQPENKLPGLAGKMTARAAAHIRRLALIFALLDEFDIVDVQHLRAAERIWNYCHESARYIFTGTTGEQDQIRRFVERNGPATIAQIRRQVFHDHKKAEWVRAQVEGLIRNPSQGVVFVDGKLAVKK